MTDNSDEKMIAQRRAIQKIELLPSIPIVLQKIISTSSDPHSSALDMQNIIIKDQSISAAILRLANSAYYGYAKHVEDIVRAIVVIGFNTAVSVAISVSVLKTVAEKIDGEEFDKNEFWKHCIGAGEAGRIIAGEINYENPSRAYLLGLLHDIGKVALSFINKSDFDDAVFESRAVDTELFNSEKQIFGFDHQEAGEWLCTRWQLPESIIAGVRYHHAIEECPEEFVPEALVGHIANILTKSAKIGNSGNEQVPLINPQVEKMLHFKTKSFKSAKKALLEKREEIDNFLELLL